MSEGAYNSKITYVSSDKEHFTVLKEGYDVILTHVKIRKFKCTPTQLVEKLAFMKVL